MRDGGTATGCGGGGIYAIQVRDGPFILLRQNAGAEGKFVKETITMCVCVCVCVRERERERETAAIKRCFTASKNIKESCKIQLV
jgi:hypothetical protein